MEATKATTGVIVPAEVSPELLEPLVTVVAVLGELAATPGDVPLPAGSLRAGLMSLLSTIRRVMGHRHGEATRLRRALATAGATPEPAAVPRATAGDAWASAAAVTREWREAVATAEATWAKVTGDAARLRDACRTAATAGDVPRVTASHLAEAVAQGDKAQQEVVVAARTLPVATEADAVAEVLAAHDKRLREATAGLRAATEATEAAAVAMVETGLATERGRRAAAAPEPLGRLVAACEGATRFYGHLRHRLEAIEATLAAGHGGPQELLAAVAVAEGLWDASARLAKGHLLGTLRVAQGLVTTLGVPSATAAADVAQRCRDAIAALPGLLPPRGRP